MAADIANPEASKPLEQSPSKKTEVLRKTLDLADKPADDRYKGKEVQSEFGKDTKKIVAELKTLNPAVLHEAVQSTSDRMKIAPEIIFLWINGPEIQKEGEAIDALVKGKKDKQFYHAIKKAGAEGKKFTERAQKIMNLLGHTDVPADGNYGDPENGPLGLAVRTLQETLKASGSADLGVDGRFGQFTLNSLEDLLASEERRAEEEIKAAVQKGAEAHDAALQEFQNLFGKDATIKELDLPILDSYSGNRIGLLNQKELLDEETYDPKTILLPRKEWRSTDSRVAEILNRETQILQKAIAEKNEEKAIVKRFEELPGGEGTAITRYRSGIGIYTETQEQNLSVRAVKKADELLALSIKPAFDNLVGKPFNALESLKSAVTLWKEIPKTAEQSQRTSVDALNSFVSQSLTTPKALHWEEAQSALVGAPSAVQDTVTQFVKALKENPTPDGPNGYNGFPAEIVRLQLEALRSVRTRPATDTLGDLIAIAKRSTLIPDAKVEGEKLVTTKEFQDLAIRAFKEIRAEKGGEKGKEEYASALKRLEKLKGIYDEAEGTGKLQETLREFWYNNAGSIDRELYGHFGLIDEISRKELPAGLDDAGRAAELLERVQPLLPEGTVAMNKLLERARDMERGSLFHFLGQRLFGLGKRVDENTHAKTDGKEPPLPPGVLDARKVITGRWEDGKFIPYSELPKAAQDLKPAAAATPAEIPPKSPETLRAENIISTLTPKYKPGDHLLDLSFQFSKGALPQLSNLTWEKTRDGKLTIFLPNVAISQNRKSPIGEGLDMINIFSSYFPDRKGTLLTVESSSATLKFDLSPISPTAQNMLRIEVERVDAKAKVPRIEIRNGRTGETVTKPGRAPEGEPSIVITKRINGETVEKRGETAQEAPQDIAKNFALMLKTEKYGTFRISAEYNQKENKYDIYLGTPDVKMLQLASVPVEGIHSTAELNTKLQPRAVEMSQKVDGFFNEKTKKPPEGGPASVTETPNLARIAELEKKVADQIIPAFNKQGAMKIRGKQYNFTLVQDGANLSVMNANESLFDIPIQTILQGSSADLPSRIRFIKEIITSAAIQNSGQQTEIAISPQEKAAREAEAKRQKENKLEDILHDFKYRKKSKGVTYNFELSVTPNRKTFIIRESSKKVVIYDNIDVDITRGQGKTLQETIETLQGHILRRIQDGTVARKVAEATPQPAAAATPRVENGLTTQSEQQEQGTTLDDFAKGFQYTLNGRKNNRYLLTVRIDSARKNLLLISGNRQIGSVELASKVSTERKFFKSGLDDLVHGYIQRNKGEILEQLDAPEPQKQTPQQLATAAGAIGIDRRSGKNQFPIIVEVKNNEYVVRRPDKPGEILTHFSTANIISTDQIRTAVQNERKKILDIVDPQQQQKTPEQIAREAGILSTVDGHTVFAYPKGTSFYILFDRIKQSDVEIGPAKNSEELKALFSQKMTSDIYRRKVERKAAAAALS